MRDDTHNTRSIHDFHTSHSVMFKSRHATRPFLDSRFLQLLQHAASAMHASCAAAAASTPGYDAGCCGAQPPSAASAEAANAGGKSNAMAPLLAQHQFDVSACQRRVSERSQQRRGRRPTTAAPSAPARRTAGSLRPCQTHKMRVRHCQAPPRARALRKGRSIRLRQPCRPQSRTLDRAPCGRSAAMTSLSVEKRSIDSTPSFCVASDSAPRGSSSTRMRCVGAAAAGPMSCACARG